MPVRLVIAYVMIALMIALTGLALYRWRRVRMADRALRRGRRSQP